MAITICLNPASTEDSGTVCRHLAEATGKVEELQGRLAEDEVRYTALATEKEAAEGGLSAQLRELEDEKGLLAGELEKLRLLSEGVQEGQSTALARIEADLSETRAQLEQSLERQDELGRKIRSLKDELASSRKRYSAAESERMDVEKRFASLESALKATILDKLILLGHTYRSDEKHEEAEEIYNLVLRYDPNNGSAYIAIAEMYFAAQDYRRSEEYYSKAASLLRAGEK